MAKRKPMTKKQKKIEERIEKIESVLFRKLQNKDIPADISLPEDATYLNLNCGKCKEFLGSLTISDNSDYLTNFYNRYCPRCGNKTIIDEEKIKKFIPIINERKKYQSRIWELEKKLQRKKSVSK